MVATKSVNCHGLNSYNALERRWLPPSMLTVMDSIAIMPWRGDGCHQVSIVNCHGLKSVNCHGLNSYNVLERRWLPPSLLTVMDSIVLMPWRGDGCHQVC